MGSRQREAGSNLGRWNNGNPLSFFTQQEKESVTSFRKWVLRLSLISINGSSRGDKIGLGGKQLSPPEQVQNQVSQVFSLLNGPPLLVNFLHIVGVGYGVLWEADISSSLGTIFGLRSYLHLHTKLCGGRRGEETVSPR